jgi:hypothetical protein
MLRSADRRERIVAFAERQRLPAIYQLHKPTRHLSPVGCLHRKDSIKGASPAGLPVLEPKTKTILPFGSTFGTATATISSSTSLAYDDMMAVAAYWAAVAAKPSEKITLRQARV